ncbi:MAG: hypothetical protein ABI706_16995 [Ilumatobacteraceae bacterium]
MSNVPEGAQLSEDGQYWWDGENWQLVEGANDNANAGGNDNTGGEVSAEELTPVNDSGVEPGDESLIDERLKPYFEPNYDAVEDDYSYAEQDEVLDDSQATGGGTDNNNNNNNNDNQNQEGT